jgi:hypothetical protein
MLIHRQNLYAPRGKRSPGRRNAQSRELVNKVKIIPLQHWQTNIFSIPKEWSSKSLNNIPNSCSFRCITNMTALVNTPISNYRGINDHAEKRILLLQLASEFTLTTRSTTWQIYLFIYPICVIIISGCQLCTHIHNTYVHNLYFIVTSKSI